MWAHGSPGVSGREQQAAAAALPEAMMSMEDTSESFNLSNVRDSLIRQEDTIIFALIERAQFGRNEPVYSASSLQAGGSSLGFWPNGRGLTLLEWLLRETEAMHGKIRRYTSPDEHPFYPVDDQVLVLPLMEYPSVLAEYAKDININQDVMALYLDVLLPGITEPVDDGNYGSSAMHDVLALQALSKRIHYGKFVAEAKFREDPERYRSLIEAQDADGIMDALTYVRQEQNVVERVRSKAAAIGKDYTAVPEDGSLPLYKVDPQVVADLYDKWVMPLTKKVQVQYLLRRLESP